MEKDIYDILNGIDTDLGEYKEIELSEHEHRMNAKRILSKINKQLDKDNMKTMKIRKKVAAASLLAMIGVASATTISFASEGRMFHYLFTFFSGSIITNEYDEQTGIGKSTIEMNATENPPVKLEGGKLYFIVNESKIDITKLVSDTVPYLGEYVDEHNIVHKFIIGGQPIEEGYGYEENLFEESGQFIGSSGYNGSKVEGNGDNEPEWLTVGRIKVGRN